RSGGGAIICSHSFVDFTQSICSFSIVMAWHLSFQNRRLHAEADEMKREIISAQQALAESQHLLNELQKPNNQFTEAGDHERTVAGASATTRSIEFTDYEKQLSALSDKLALFQAEVKMKDDEIRRLELEIGNAHRCNQQLNAKLGSLSSSSTVELKKALKEKTLECDSLKKKVEKFERDKQQWENQKRALESKQPMDVQMLQREKRELTMQLDREQNEKHELFLQINTLIAQVAEANRDAAEQQNSALLKAENDSLKSQLGNIQKIQSQLNSDVHSLQEELRRKTAAVESCKEDAKRRLDLVENEKSKLQESVEGLERELQMKSAALQSLMLAKQDKRSGADAATIERLTSDNEELTKQLTDTAKQVVAESEQKSLLSKQIEELRGELNAMKEKVARHEAEKIKNQKELEKKTAEVAEYRQRVELLQSSSGDREKQISTLERKLSERQSAHEAVMLELANLKAIVDASKSDNEIMKLRLEESQRTAKENEERCAEMQTNLQVGANAAHGLEAKIAASEAKLQAAEERTQKCELELERHRDEIKKLSGQLNEQEQRNAEAQFEIKTSDAKIETLEAEIKNLRNQLDAQHGIDEQVKHLREELRLAGERNAALIEAIQKTENDADEADRSNRETIEELEEEVRSLQEKMRVMEGGEEEKLNRIADLQSEKAKFEQKSRDAESKMLTVTKDLEVARAELSKFELTIEQMRAENNKLMAKASLEDEVLTLATSLRTAHDDISAKQEEIGKLNKEIRNLREENDRLTPSERQAESLRVELLNLKQQFENIKRECSSTEEEKTKMTNVMQEELLKLRKDLEAKEAEIAQTRSELELRHQQTLLDIKKQHELRITEMEQQVEHLKEQHLQENSQLQTNIKNLEDAVNVAEDCDGQVSHLKDQSVKLNVELRALKETISEGEQKKHVMEVEVTKLIEENKLSAQKLTNLERRTIQLQQESDYLKKELEETKKQASAVEEKLKNENVTLTTELGKSAAILRDKQHELRQRDNQIIELREEVQLEKGRCKTLENERNMLAAKSTELGEQLKMLRETNERMQKHKSDVESSGESLKLELESMKKMLAFTGDNKNLAYRQSALPERQGGLLRNRSSEIRVQSVHRFHGDIGENDELVMLTKSPEMGEQHTAHVARAIFVEQEAAQTKAEPQNVADQSPPMNTELASLPDQVESYRNQIAKLRIENTMLHDKLHDFSIEREATESRILHAEKQNQQAQEISENLRRELEEAKNVIADIVKAKKQEVVELNEKLVNIGRERSDVLTEMSSVRAQLEQTQRHLDELQQEKSLLQQQSINLIGELQSLKENVLHAQKNNEDLELQSMKKELAAVIKEKSLIECKSTELQSEVLSLRGRVEHLDFQLLDVRRGDPSINKELVVLEKSPELTSQTLIAGEQLTSVRKEITQLNFKLSDVENEKVQTENVPTSVGNEMKSAKQQLPDSKSSKESLKTEPAAVAMELEQLKKGMNDSSNKQRRETESNSVAIKAEFEAANKRLNVLLGERTAEVEELRKKLESLVIESSAAQAKIFSLQGHLDAAQQQLCESQNEKNSLKNESILLKTQLQKAMEDVRDVEKLRTEADLNLARLMQELESVKQQLISAVEERNRVQSNTGSLENQVVMLRNRISELDAQLFDLYRGDEAKNEELVLLKKTGEMEATKFDQSEEVNTMREQVMQFRTKLQDLENEKARAQSEVSSLRDQLQLSNEQFSQLQLENDEARLNKEKLQNELISVKAALQKSRDAEALSTEHLSDQLQQMKATLVCSEEKKNLLEKQLVEWKEQMEKLYGELKNSEKARELAEKEASMLKEQTELLKAKTSQFEAQDQACEGQISSLKLEMELLRRNLLKEEEDKDRLHNESIDLKVKVKVADEKVKLIEAEKQTINTEFNALKNKFEMQGNELAKREAALSKLESDMVMLRNELSKVQSEAIESNASKELALKQSEQLNETSLKYQQRIDEYTAENKRLDAEKTRYETEANVARKRTEELETKVRDYEKVEESMRKLLKASKEEANEQKRMAGKHFETLNQREAQIQRLKEELATVSLQLNEHKKSVDEKELIIVNLRKDHDRIFEELNILKGERNEKEAIDAERRRLHDELQSFKDKADSDSRQLQNDLTLARNGLKLSENERNSLDEELKSCKANLEKTEHERQKLQEELKATKADFNSSETNRQRLEEEIKKAETELMQLRTEMKALRDQTNAHSAQMNSLNNELNRSRQKSATLSSELNHLKGENEQLKNEVELRKKRLEQANSEKAMMRATIDASSAETHALQRERSEHEYALRRIHELEAKEQRYNKEVQELRDRINVLNECGKTTTIVTLSSQMNAHKDTLRNMEVELARVIAEKERAVSERAADQKKIDELSSINEELTANIKGLSDLLEAETRRVESLASEKRRVEAEASNAEEERDRLQTELQELRRRDSNVAESEDEVKGKVSELMAENARLAGELLKERNRTGWETVQEREDLRQEFTKRLQMRDEEWRKKVEEEQQKQSKEMQKLKDELAKRVQRRDEEWRTKVEKELAVKNAEIEKLQREVLKRSTSLSGKDENFGKLRAELNQKEVELESMKLKNDALVQERDQLKMEASRDAENKHQAERLSTELHAVEERLKKSDEEKVKLKEKLAEAEMNLKECKDSITKLKQNGVSPLPPPRRSHAGSDVSDISIHSLTPAGNNDDEMKKLKAELDKQHRLIVVLRRKLQAAQSS
uniref:Nucleoprotein TPR n=1 Tax=Parascaris univalens TaxID=6257 RepID=A0A914ZML9_PARUN